MLRLLTFRPLWHLSAYLNFFKRYVFRIDILHMKYAYRFPVKVISEFSLAQKEFREILS